MNSWSYYKKHFAWINFSHLVPLTIKRIILFLSSECLLVCCVYRSSLESRFKETGSHVRIGAQEPGKFQFYGSELSFPSYIAECTLFASVYISILPPPRLCWDYWLLAFHWKITFVIMWCGLLNIVYVAFLVSVKSFKTRMCKIF